MNWKLMAIGLVFTTSTAWVQAPAARVDPAKQAARPGAAVRPEPSDRRVAELQRTIFKRNLRRFRDGARQFEEMGRQEEANWYWASLYAVQAAEAARLEVAQQAELARQQAEFARLQLEQNQANATVYAAQETALGMVTAAEVLAHGRHHIRVPVAPHHPHVPVAPHHPHMTVCAAPPPRARGAAPCQGQAMKKSQGFMNRRP